MSEKNLPELFRVLGHLTSEHLAACMAPLPKEAVERSKGSETGKGYNTTGYGYQYVVDRANDVFGVGCWKLDCMYREQQDGTTSKGKPWYRCDIEGSLQLGLWVDGEWKIAAEVPASGWHRSLDPGDAKKGATTNSLKKSFAYLAGIGGDAFRGAIDDDNTPAGDDRVPSGLGENREWLLRMYQNEDKVLRSCADSKAADFVSDSMNRLRDDGDNTRFSESQVKWLRDIYNEYEAWVDSQVEQGASPGAKDNAESQG